MKPHYYILDVTGKPRPPHHETESDAWDAAKSLADKEPGVEFVVYKALWVALAEPRPAYLRPVTDKAAVEEEIVA